MGCILIIIGDMTVLPQQAHLFLVIQQIVQLLNNSLKTLFFAN